MHLLEIVDPTALPTMINVYPGRELGKMIMTASMEVEFNRASRSADEPPWSWYKARDESGRPSNLAAVFASVEAEERDRE